MYSSINISSALGIDHCCRYHSHSPLWYTILRPNPIHWSCSSQGLCSSIGTTFDTPLRLGGPTSVVWCWYVFHIQRSRRFLTLVERILGSVMCQLLLILTARTLTLTLSYSMVRLHPGLQYCGDLLCHTNFRQPLCCQWLLGYAMLYTMPWLL